MAEAIELDLNTTDISQIDPRVKETLIELQSGQKKNKKFSIPTQYTTHVYYDGDSLGGNVLKQKYLAPWEIHPWELWERQAIALSSVEKTKTLQDKWKTKFFDALEDFKFVPGGRIMHGAGRDDITTTLNNCYVVGIENDSVKSIYQTINDEALTYKYGGGCGHDLSILRPSGDQINGTGGFSCGPTGFMNLFSENTNTIAQHGRRGANMQTLRVDHPDIEKFISIKTGDINMVKYSNISVLLTHDFMKAVEADTTFDLVYKGKTYNTVSARKLWDKIIHHAHASAEPGLLFWDTMKEYHNAEYTSPLESTNPCAEQPLPNGGCCNLGAVNLERFVDEKGNFQIESFKEIVSVGTRFLDNVIDYNMDRHALDIQKKNAEMDRRIGLGILGLGDMLVKMQIKYDSIDALQTVDQIMKIFRDTAYETSIHLATEKNSFPNFDWKGYSNSKFIQSLPKKLQSKIQQHGIRNSTITTVAPTGSGAIVSRVTSGIEPIFATSYNRRVKKNDGDGKTFNEYKVIHPIIKKLFTDDKNLPDYVITAHTIDPFFRVKMQGIVQKYIDSSISSTVNLPNNVSKETVADIYMTAYKSQLKGITVYREGSREGILITEQKDDDKKIEAKAHTEIKSSGEPRIRPSITYGETKRIRTGEGTLYITVNEDENGLCEVFTAIGKAGGHAAAQSEAISRLISLALRSGVNPKAIVKQLKGISGPNPTWEDGRLILSTPDAIGKALDDYLNNRNVKNSTDKKSPTITMAEESEEKSKYVADFTTRAITNCPDCGGPVQFESGCITCQGCGYSKCD
jgi:ribonucleoside-diphosphate reductase alpha chain